MRRPLRPSQQRLMSPSHLTARERRAWWALVTLYPVNLCAWAALAGAYLPV